MHTSAKINTLSLLPRAMIITEANCTYVGMCIAIIFIQTLKPFCFATKMSQSRVSRYLVHATSLLFVFLLSTQNYYITCGLYRNASLEKQRFLIHTISRILATAPFLPLKRCTVHFDKPTLFQNDIKLNPMYVSSTVCIDSVYYAWLSQSHRTLILY